MSDELIAVAGTGILELLKWAPRICLRDGMAKTYAWIYDEYTKEHGKG